MKRAGLAVLLLCGCYDFNRDFQTCQAQGRCDGGNDAGTSTRVNVRAPGHRCGAVELAATKAGAPMVTRKDLLKYPCVTTAIHASFAPSSPSPCASAGMVDLQLHDVDGNATPDMVIACSDGVEVYTNSGGDTPTYTTKPRVSFERPKPFAAADLDADGDLDLAVPSDRPALLFLLDNAPMPPSLFADAGALPFADAGYDGKAAAVAGDFDGKSRVDVVVARRDQPPVVFYAGDGGFRAAVPLAGDSSASDGVALAAGNVVGASAGDEVLQVGNCTLTLWLRPFESVLMGLTNAGPDPTHVAAGDLDRDGFIDMVVANKGGTRCFSSTDAGSISVVRGAMNNATVEVPVPVGVSPGHVALADLNADHYLDAVVLDYRAVDDARVYVLLGSASGFGTPTEVITSANGVSSVSVADLNRDGLPDIVLGQNRNTYVHRNLSQ